MMGGAEFSLYKVPKVANNGLSIQMLYEQISLIRDEFRLKSTYHILAKMSKITN